MCLWSPLPQSTGDVQRYETHDDDNFTQVQLTSHQLFQCYLEGGGGGVRSCEDNSACWQCYSNGIMFTSLSEVVRQRQTLCLAGQALFVPS